jgi:hypothetical protein
LHFHCRFLSDGLLDQSAFDPAKRLRLDTLPSATPVRPARPICRDSQDSINDGAVAPPATTGASKKADQLSAIEPAIKPTTILDASAAALCSAPEPNDALGKNVADTNRPVWKGPRAASPKRGRPRRALSPAADAAKDLSVFDPRDSDLVVDSVIFVPVAPLAHDSDAYR